MSALGQKQTCRSAKRHVRFTPNSGHVQCTSRCPLSANSGHREGKSEAASYGPIAVPSAQVMPVCAIRNGANVRRAIHRLAGRSCRVAGAASSTAAEAAPNWLYEWPIARGIRGTSGCRVPARPRRNRFCRGKEHCGRVSMGARPIRPATRVCSRPCGATRCGACGGRRGSFCSGGKASHLDNPNRLWAGR